MQTTDGFDAGTVAPSAVEFGGASPVRWTLEDVGGDGDLDAFVANNIVPTRCG